MIAERFGSTPPLTLGVEEEIMILDAQTHEQVAGVAEITSRLDGRGLPGSVKTELHASIAELNTPPLAAPAEALHALTALRHAAADAAGQAGLTIAAGGCHPFSRWQTQPIVKEERYVTFVGWAGVSARRQTVQGLHVHLSVPSAEACWLLLEAMLPWLPVVLALSANSPWLDGELTGFASNRAGVLTDLPRAGTPPEFSSYSDWKRWVERLVRIGVLEDETRIWWDVRPAPKFGTLEIRVADQPTDVRRSAAFAALLQALADTLVRNALDDVRPAPRGDYNQNRWAAARFGADAQLIHPDGERMVRAADLGRELLELVGPSAERLGSSDLLGVLDPERTEADLQARWQTAAEATGDLVTRSLA
ncbi:MAG: YbdK family carboxylate-amine ligase [Actinobacteria bacterium]|nr:YbdK family carboxylate-amine ligase [Actinomycetota bacterium]MBV8598711.1 YbdK family carboxylate-amine ligase [Actinomycetota bacterium]